MSFFPNMLGFLAFFVFCENLMVFSQLTPDNEDQSDTGELYQFLEKLENMSGLNANSTYPFTIKCPDASTVRTCILNPNGTVLWDARDQLYATHLTQNYDSNAIEANTTIDGCLLSSNDEIGYQTCMKTVRMQMLDYLDTTFKQTIQDILNKNCTLVTENCV